MNRIWLAVLTAATLGLVSTPTLATRSAADVPHGLVLKSWPTALASGRQGYIYAVRVRWHEGLPQTRWGLRPAFVEDGTATFYITEARGARIQQGAVVAMYEASGDVGLVVEPRNEAGSLLAGPENGQPVGYGYTP